MLTKPATKSNYAGRIKIALAGCEIGVAIMNYRREATAECCEGNIMENTSCQGMANFYSSFGLKFYVLICFDGEQAAMVDDTSRESGRFLN